MNKTSLIIIVILVIILGGWMILRDKEPAVTEIPGSGFAISDEFGGPSTNSGQVPPVSSPEDSKKAITVTYTDNGFSPATLTVGVNDTVVFVNNSSEPLWVASDPHPTHTNLPSFDEKAAITKGSTYNHTFTNVGTWTYHNHVGSSHKGTIIVK